MKFRWMLFWTVLIGLLFPWVSEVVAYLISLMINYNDDSLVTLCGYMTVIMMALVLCTMLIYRKIDQLKK